MELQKNGLPFGAEFVARRQARGGEYFQQGDGWVGRWPDGPSSKTHFIIIRFPTYGMPLEDAFAKYGAGRKLLGGSVRTAWGTPEPMMEFIAPDGMIDEQDGFAKGPYLCLEPLPKKREVLVLELPIDEHENVKILDAFGYGSTYAAKDLTSRNSSVIKEVEDAKYGAGRKSHDALLAALKRAVDLLANLADQYPCSCVLCTECCAAIAQDEALKEEGAV